MTDVTSSSASRNVDRDVLQIVDSALPFVMLFKLSAAWLYPSFIPSDSVTGLPLVNALFLAFCLYGTMRLLFTRPAALVFAEPAYLALLVLAAATITISVSPANSFGMVRTALLFFCSCVFIRYHFAPRYILQMFAVSMGLLMLVSIIVALLTPLGTMGGFDAGRWRGVFNHKNTLGENAAITSIVAIGLLLTGRSPRLWLLITFIIAVLCLLMAGSATAVAIFAAALLVCGAALSIVRLNINRHQGFWLFIITIMLLAFLAYASIGIVTQNLGRDLTFTGRTEIWEQFLYFAVQRPWTGWGWATISTSDAMLPIIREVLNLPHIQTPHNGFLSTLVELGRPGLALLTIWLLTIALQAVHAAIKGKSAVALIRLGLICGLVIHSLFESTSGAMPSLWLFLLLSTNTRVMVRW